MRQLTGPEQAARTIFEQALAASSAEEALARKLVVLDDGAESSAGVEQTVDLRGVRRMLVIAMGKGAATMLAALLRRDDLVRGREVEGILVAPEALSPMPKGIRFIRGDHPLPTENSFTAARSILDLLDDERRSDETFCWFLISGGASAMVELPLDERIGLDDTRSFHRELVHCGASIAEINCVRKHFSAVKGGRLGQRAAGLRQITLLMSDVPTGQVDALASGPTLPDSSTVEQCRAVLQRYDLLRRFPPSVARFFDSGELEETPKVAEPGKQWMVLLSTEDLTRHARVAAEQMGYVSEVDDRCDDWDYRKAGEYLLERVREMRRRDSRVCLISGGEVLVQVRQEGVERPGTGKIGVGGRNQHLALYAAMQMGGGDEGLAFLSCGSDGVDGNSPAAGAVVSLKGLEMSGVPWRARTEEALREFSSYEFLREAGCAIETGQTGLNLRDLRVLIAE